MRYERVQKETRRDTIEAPLRLFLDDLGLVHHISFRVNDIQEIEAIREAFKPIEGSDVQTPFEVPGKHSNDFT